MNHGARMSSRWCVKQLSPGEQGLDIHARQTGLGVAPFTSAATDRSLTGPSVRARPRVRREGRGGGALLAVDANADLALDAHAGDNAAFPCAGRSASRSPRFRTRRPRWTRQDDPRGPPRVRPTSATESHRRVRCRWFLAESPLEASRRFRSCASERHSAANAGRSRMVE